MSGSRDYPRRGPLWRQRVLLVIWSIPLLLFAFFEALLEAWGEFKMDFGHSLDDLAKLWRGEL